MMQDTRNARRRDRYSEAKALREAVLLLTSAKSHGDLGDVDAAVSAVQRGLHTTPGKRAVPGLALLVEREVAARTAHLATALKTVVEKFPPRSGGRKHVVAHAVGGLPSGSRAEVAALLGVSRKYATKCVTWVCSRKTMVDTSDAISNTNGRSGVEYSQIGTTEGRLLLMWVMREASMKSGQKPRKTGITLYTEQPKWRFYVRYKIEFFHLCLMEAHEDEKYWCGQVPLLVKVHDANCWAAMWKSTQDGFDMTHVFAERQEKYRQDRLANGHDADMACMEPSKKGRIPTAEARSCFDPGTWELVPRSYRAIMSFLSKVNHESGPSYGLTHAFHSDAVGGVKWYGISILCTTDPKHCPLCENGIRHRLRLKELEGSHTSDSINETYEGLEAYAEILKLQKKIARYEKHLKSMSVQAAYKKELQRRCEKDPSVIIVTADFVAWFARDGSKVRDLVLVLSRRSRKTYVHCINWGDTAGCDTHFVADAMKHVLLKTTLFRGVSVVHWFSDHGPCFDNARTFYVTSCMHTATAKLRDDGVGIVMHTGFGTEYHAADVADGAGAAACATYSRWALENQTSGNGPLFVKMMNSGYLTSCQRQTATRIVAFDFSTVDYGSEVFAAVDGPGRKSNQNDVSALQNVGSVAYSWIQDGVVTRMEGIVRVRELCGVGDWVFVDLLHSATSGRGVMCGKCTADNSHPVHHRGQPCLARVAEPILPSDIVQPDIARLEGHGVQESRKPIIPRSKGVVRTGEGNLTVKMMKAFCRKNGLSTVGRRDVLLARVRTCRSGNTGIAADDADDADDDDDDDDVHHQGPLHSHPANLAPHRLYPEQAGVAGCRHVAAGLAHIVSCERARASRRLW